MSTKPKVVWLSKSEYAHLSKTYYIFLKKNIHSLRKGFIGFTGCGFDVASIETLWISGDEGTNYFILTKHKKKYLRLLNDNYSHVCDHGAL